ncbi:hypothetical protein NDU88_010791 [Pleurodeles waltl]|uniref:Uncharacterized protein n=1 Tax=Pleurodeles waltl TaxID=8319 RepID=A0AAV7PZF3_PLEWA|nr:hypothetical protein NDU88_010791 [Pleurodeles waltl]
MKGAGCRLELTSDMEGERRQTLKKSGKSTLLKTSPLASGEDELSTDSEIPHPLVTEIAALEEDKNSRDQVIQAVALRMQQQDP